MNHETWSDMTAQKKARQAAETLCRIAQHIVDVANDEVLKKTWYSSWLFEDICGEIRSEEELIRKAVESYFIFVAQADKEDADE